MKRTKDKKKMKIKIKIKMKMKKKNKIKIKNKKQLSPSACERVTAPRGETTTTDSSRLTEDL
ncbi:hypothetical protein EYF80_013271 [Liparis tanakae]|uniref:Uncharacterized protein n=1 Tax=Liparis tanakae TaxID=230148 RepID=A0A4Z2IEP9_9TELE|nr:hypothetical protein EYF80_013271 [Liparis tanakae]